MSTVLYLFHLRNGKVHFAFFEMAFGRRRARRIPGVEFAKLMGTGTGRTFTPSDADLSQWAILFVGENLDAIESSQTIKRWKNNSSSYEKYILKPLSSHGEWSGTSPFVVGEQARSEGPVVAITRARLKWSKALRFWRSIPPVVEDLHKAPGLRFSIGIGEAPIGLQGTFSLWESESSLRDFAYKNSPHRKAIEDTEKFGWYSEELFARFELINKADFHHVH